MLDPIISPISNPLRVGPKGWILSNKLEKIPRQIPAIAAIKAVRPMFSTL
jgi:hypothetical protein